MFLNILLFIFRYLISLIGVQALNGKSICESINYCSSGYKCANKQAGDCYYLCDNVNLDDAAKCKNEGKCVVEFDYETQGLKSKCR